MGSFTAQQHADPSALYAPTPERITELRAGSYLDYLASGEWRETRRITLARAEHRCERCRERPALLDVHHRTYERLGQEWPEDLEVLCRPCHEREHGVPG